MNEENFSYLIKSLNNKVDQYVERDSIINFLSFSNMASLFGIIRRISKINVILLQSINWPKLSINVRLSIYLVKILIGAN